MMCLLLLEHPLDQVNRQVAARLMAQQELQQQAAEAEAADVDGAPAKKRKAAAEMANPLADERFKAMFVDEAFAIDENSDEYRLLHPNVGAGKKGGAAADAPSEAERLLAEHFQELSDGDDEDGAEISEGQYDTDGDPADTAEDQPLQGGRSLHQQQQQRQQQQQQQQ
jgi:ribosome biogenesis protein ENP2